MNVSNFCLFIIYRLFSCCCCCCCFRIYFVFSLKFAIEFKFTRPSTHKIKICNFEILNFTRLGSGQAFQSKRVARQRADKQKESLSIQIQSKYIYICYINGISNILGTHWIKMSVIKIWNELDMYVYTIEIMCWNWIDALTAKHMRPDELKSIYRSKKN